jgi:hypothetical protein
VFVYVSFGERDEGEKDILVSEGRGRDNEEKENVRRREAK